MRTVRAAKGKKKVAVICEPAREHPELFYVSRLVRDDFAFIFTA